MSSSTFASGSQSASGFYTGPSPSPSPPPSPPPPVNRFLFGQPGHFDEFDTGASVYLRDVLRIVRETGTNVILENVVTKVEYREAAGHGAESLRIHVARVGPDGIVYKIFVVLVVLESPSPDESTVCPPRRLLVIEDISSRAAPVTSTTDDSGVVTSTSKANHVVSPSDLSSGIPSADSFHGSRTTLSDVFAESIRACFSCGEEPNDKFRIHTAPSQLELSPPEHSDPITATLNINPAAKIAFERLACIIELAGEAATLYHNTSTNCNWITRWIWFILTKSVAPAHIYWKPKATETMGKWTVLGQIPIKTVDDSESGVLLRESHSLLLSTEGATKEWLQKYNKRWAELEREFQDASEVSLLCDILFSLHGTYCYAGGTVAYTSIIDVVVRNGVLLNK